MKARDFLTLLLLEALVLAAVAFFQHSPGYMDADYYTVMGQRLAHGQATEPFLWNYLDDPQGVPHPAFAYWQPLPAALAAWGVRWWPAAAPFAAARWPFFLLALLVPPLTAWLAYRLTRRREQAWLSGVLAVAAGFYLPYLAIPESFTPLLFLGGLFFLVAGWAEPWRWQDAWRPGQAMGKVLSRRLWALQAVILGVLAAGFYLTRAEGALWLAAAWAALAKKRWRGWAWVTLGFAVLAGPWMLRNWVLFGAPFSPAGSKALWLRHYDELFVYPASRLTPAHWLAGGVGEILRARLHAAGANLLSALAVQGAVIWLPFALWGGWRLRQRRVVRLAAGMWLLLWLLMSLVYPFAGERGGYFHTAAALQPVIWALAPAGLADALRRLARRRGWPAHQAWSVLGWGLLALTVFLSGWVVARRVVGSDPSQPAWDREARTYRRLDAGLQALDVPREALILVNNPPGFTLVTGRSTLAVPDGDAQTVAAVARRYGARYWLLEVHHPKPLNHFYCHPTTVPPPWRFIGQAADAPVFLLEEGP